MRNYDGDRLVRDEVVPGSEWVIEGDGVPTVKYDGTSCMIRDGKLYKRQEFKADQTPPADFEEVGHDEETGKRVGWRPVGDGPEDKWHRAAFELLVETEDGTADVVWDNGTYELLGPKIQGNPEGLAAHVLIRHGGGMAGAFTTEVPRDFELLKAWLADRDIEGIVFHHPDGRMAKIKLRDFGLKRR